MEHSRRQDHAPSFRACHPMVTEFRQATLSDAAAVGGLMREYYLEESYPFREASALRAVRQLIENADLGWLWILESEQEVVGYLAVTLGFSLEYRGRDAFIDELYLRPSARGRGLGSKALDLAVEACRAREVHALHLEVERDKTEVRRWYRRSGFEEQDRSLMTRHLSDP